MFHHLNLTHLEYFSNIFAAVRHVGSSKVQAGVSGETLPKRMELAITLGGKGPNFPPSFQMKISASFISALTYLSFIIGVTVRD
jgi:hypothetical protein